MKHATLGSCVRILRKQNNMTQAQLADHLGITDKAVSKWERDLSYPDIALFPKLADELGTTVDELLRECQDEYRPPKLLQSFELSRDIRMPIHIIMGFCEIIRNNHDDPEMLQRYLDGIKVSCEYMMMRLGDTRQSPTEEAENYIQTRIDSGQEKPQTADFTGKRILVAEDMEVNREIAGEILKQTGAITEFAENGRICLRKIEKRPAGYYDLILMDLEMPEMDGLETTRRIRSLPSRKKAEIPIVALTSNVSEIDRKAALEAGMNAFTEKPVLVDRLFETIRQYMIKG